MRKNRKWLDDLYEKAFRNKRITYDEIGDLLPEDFINADDIEEIVTTLASKGVAVTDKIEEPEVPAAKRGKPVIPRSEDPTKSYFRELSKLGLLTREEEIEYSKQMEEGYRQITCYLFEPLQMVRKLIEECKAVEEGSRALDQVARVEFECLFDKKALWRDRQKFVRRVKHIEREVNALDLLLKRTRDSMPTKRILRRKEKLYKRIQQLSLQHHLINNFIQEFKRYAEQTISLNRRIHEMGQRRGKSRREIDVEEVRNLKKELKECERFFGRRSEELSKAMAEIDRWRARVSRPGTG